MVSGKEGGNDRKYGEMYNKVVQYITQYTIYTIQYAICNIYETIRYSAIYHITPHPITKHIVTT